MHAVYSQFGQLIGWISENVLFGADGSTVAVVRNGIIYSRQTSEYWGRVTLSRGHYVWTA